MEFVNSCAKLYFVDGVVVGFSHREILAWTLTFVRISNVNVVVLSSLITGMINGQLLSKSYAHRLAKWYDDCDPTPIVIARITLANLW